MKLKMKSTKTASANVLFIIGALCCLWAMLLLEECGCHQVHYAHDEKDDRHADGNDTADSKKSLHDPKIASKEHITEHLEEEAHMNFTDMTADELEFYYFKLHDLDNNTKLDGLEIYKALVHSIPEADFEKYSREYLKKLKTTKNLSDEQLVEAKSDMKTKYYSNIVDNILDTDDVNFDGYITYPEFVTGRKAYEQEKEVPTKGVPKT
ncbi:hypothetical protein HELRODRAFT_190486 [Helobdella robusta]|uniref:EF-hand domain-containing protein n=1 Tax=Helobdella robusta TaxID=6412 RepID=T1FS13_HELRO|nr:hypothetical protein HELRODRAFT_190486 [Helobdella robusta]ESO09413.1 hypothetical protein HELRODRAFT_190486 [Helobdella robusta]